MGNKILDDPNFKRLVRHQNNLSILLSLVVLISYFSFILILAFNPSFFTVLLFSSKLSLGIVYGLLIIILSILLTIFYVLYSNLVLDKIRKQLKE